MYLRLTQKQQQLTKEKDNATLIARQWAEKERKAAEAEKRQWKKDEQKYIRIALFSHYLPIIRREEERIAREKDWISKLTLKFKEIERVVEDNPALEGYSKQISL